MWNPEKWWLFPPTKEKIRWRDFSQWNIYLFISSCQYLINGLREIFLRQQNAEYVMKYVEVNGDSRDSDVFGVI